MTSRTAATRYAGPCSTSPPRKRRTVASNRSPRSWTTSSRWSGRQPALERVLTEPGRAGAAQARRHGRAREAGGAVADRVEAAGAAGRARSPGAAGRPGGDLSRHADGSPEHRARRSDHRRRRSPQTRRAGDRTSGWPRSPASACRWRRKWTRTSSGASWRASAARSTTPASRRS